MWTIEKANKVLNDLEKLNKTGFWNTPAWAKELNKEMGLEEDVSINMVLLPYEAYRRCALAFQQYYREEFNEEYADLEFEDPEPLI